jgi:hypothetical protein
MRLHFLPLALLFLSALAPAIGAPTGWQAVLTPAGAVQLSVEGKELGTLEPGLFEHPWRMAALQPAKVGTSIVDGICRGQVRTPGGTVIETVTRCTAADSGVRLAYVLTPKNEVRLNSLHVSLSLPAARAIGGAFTMDGTRVPFPAVAGSAGLRAGTTSTLVLALADGATMSIAFPTPTPVLVQDDRQWGGGFTVRIGPQFGEAQLWAADKPLALEMRLTGSGGMTLIHDRPVTIQAGAEWIPLEVELDIEAGSTLDFSALVPWHAPAGTLGRVIATADGHFAFATQPKVPVRFYGCNLCFSGQYLSHEEADRLATRLQRLGYNTVRLHHYEGELIDRSGGTSTQLKPDKLDQLDYLVAACKARGIYVTTDLYVSRPVLAGEVWPGATGAVGMDEFKMAIPVNARAFANYSAFATALLTHVNPYTRLRWADDPALAWISLINEGNAGNFFSGLSPRVRADWTLAWNRWLAVRFPTRTALVEALGTVPEGQDPGLGTMPLPARVDGTPAGTLLCAFLVDTEREFIARSRTLLRDTLGCHALLTNCNAWTNPLQLQLARQEMDYVDDHFYVDHPQFLERPWQLPSRCPNTNPVAAGAPGGRHCAFVRLLEKPFTISEYNYSGPGRYRGVGGMLTSAMGALQDWSAIWRFTYSHSRASVLAPQPMGYFDLASDPLNQAADRAGVCLFRRGDLRPAPHAVSLVVSKDALQRQPISRSVSPSWHSLALVTRVGSEVVPAATSRPRADLALPVGGGGTGKPWLALDPYGKDAGERLLAEVRTRGWLTADNPTDATGARLQSETGELTIDGPADRFLLDTPRTAGGYAPAGGRIETKDLAIAIQDTGATVWASSLDGASLSTSRRLLLTHLTDLQNTGAVYGDARLQTLMAWGKLPHLVRAGRATVALRLTHPERARVWGLSTSGRRVGEISARVEGGRLVIPLDVVAGGKARLLYEVVVE